MQVVPENKTYKNIVKQQLNTKHLQHTLFWSPRCGPTFPTAKATSELNVINKPEVQHVSVSFNLTLWEDICRLQISSIEDLFSYLQLPAERPPVLLSWKFKHFPELLILEIPAETRKPRDQMSETNMNLVGVKMFQYLVVLFSIFKQVSLQVIFMFLNLLGHWVCLLYGLLTHHWSDD